MIEDQDLNDAALERGNQGTHVSPAESPDGEAERPEVDDDHAAAPSTPRPSSPQIRVLSDEGEATYDLYEVLTVGRVDSNDICLRDPRASKRHCEIRYEYEDSRYYLRDLGSANGTIVNGHYADVRPLEHGDRMLIGRTSLLFLCPLELAHPAPIEARPKPTRASTPLWGEGEEGDDVPEIPPLANADAEPDETADVAADAPFARAQVAADVGDLDADPDPDPDADADEIEEAFRSLPDTPETEGEDEDEDAGVLPTWAAAGASEDIVTGDAPVVATEEEGDDGVGGAGHDGLDAHVRADAAPPRRKPLTPSDEVVRLLFDDASLDGTPSPVLGVSGKAVHARADNAEGLAETDGEPASVSSDLQLEELSSRPDDMRSTDNALSPPARRYGSRGTLDEPATVSDEPMPPDIRAKIDRIAGHPGATRARGGHDSALDAGEVRTQPPIRAQTRPPQASHAGGGSAAAYAFMSTLARLRKEAEAIGDPREQMHVIYALEVLLSTPFLPEALDQLERRKP
ncbi:MAG: FHA domain-containing protein [Deltaproteobacteria bacterium]|nr:FHA domain-containing protein [Deltaproteobacteria bacterium]